MLRKRIRQVEDRSSLLTFTFSHKRERERERERDIDIVMGMMIREWKRGVLWWMWKEEVMSLRV